jgi:hypothetical protein
MPEVGISVCMSVCLVCLSVCGWTWRALFLFIWVVVDFTWWKEKACVLIWYLEQKARTRTSWRRIGQALYFALFGMESSFAVPQHLIFFLFSCFFFRLCTLNVFQKLHPACNPERKSDQD